MSFSVSRVTLPSGSASSPPPAYHVIDVWSFLTGGPDSGGTLCVLIGDEPGRRFTNIPHLKRIFTDVFYGYLEKMDCDSSNGTVFRLPPRNERTARDSEVSNQAVMLETIDRLLTRFRPDTFNSLLFLNSIQSIQQSEIDERTGTLVNSYSMVATQLPED
jgi:hypothetical protein